MEVYDEYEQMLAKKRAAEAPACAATPEAMGMVLKLSHELNSAKRQIRTMRDTLRAAKLLPAETDLARAAYEYACDGIGKDNLDWFQLVDVLQIPGTTYREPAIVLEVALTSALFASGDPQQGIYLEEVVRQFAQFRRRVFDAYEEASGDTELSIRLTRLDLSSQADGAFERWEKHSLAQSTPSAPITIGPKAKSL